jgi:hypothetical protein
MLVWEVQHEKPILDRYTAALNETFPVLADEPKKDCSAASKESADEPHRHTRRVKGRNRVSGERCLKLRHGPQSCSRWRLDGLVVTRNMNSAICA